MEPLHYRSAAELISDLKNGELTSVDVTQAFLNRIRQCNDTINAVVTLDEEKALEKARQADEVQAQGETLGALHGLPLTLKDTWEVAGMACTAGAPALKDYIPTKHADVVQRLEDAGAIILGKTNVPIYATDLQSYNKLFGVTNNPHNLAHTPGGSSGGAAAALAAGHRWKWAVISRVPSAHRRISAAFSGTSLPVPWSPSVVTFQGLRAQSRGRTWPKAGHWRARQRIWNCC